MPASGGEERTRVVLLVMVRNESTVVKRLLDSVATVDGIVVVDTGSTDTTREIVQTYIEQRGWQGLVTTDTFEDFGTNRTRSFRVCREWVQQRGWDLSDCWALVLDADHVFRGDVGATREVLARLDPVVAGALLSQTSVSGVRYANLRLLRCSADWECVGSTHEYWRVPDGTQILLLDEPQIQDLGDGGCKQNKLERDRQLLETDLERDPANPRALFYLGQTLMDAGDPAAAVPVLQERARLEKDSEEAYVAHLYLGRCHEALGHTADSRAAWLQAWELRPWRTEAPIHLADGFVAAGELFLALTVLEKVFSTLTGRALLSGAETGARVLPNNDLLFVDTRDRQFHLLDLFLSVAKPLGYGAEGFLRLDAEELATPLPQHEFDVLLDYAGAYSEPLRVVDRCEIGPDGLVQWLPWTRARDEGGDRVWTAHNPSIRPVGGSGGFEVLLRLSNYGTDDYLHFRVRNVGRPGQIVNRTARLHLGPGKLGNVLFAEELLTDLAYNPKAVALGPEDCRFIGTDPDFFATSMSHRPDCVNRMLWCHPGSEGLVKTEEVALPPGTDPARRQKNWLGFRHKQLLYIYSVSPFRVHCAATGAEVAAFDWPEGTNLVGWRGSAGPVPWRSSQRPDEAYLCAIHRPVRSRSTGLLWYHHRFLTLTNSLVPSRLSCFVRMTTDTAVEYWSGLCPVGTGEHGAYVVGYGCRDQTACLASVPQSTVEQLLFYSASGPAVPFAERVGKLHSVRSGAKNNG